MSSPSFLPVMRHTPAIGPSFLSIRCQVACAPDIFVDKVLPGVTSNVLDWPTHVSAGALLAALSVSYCQVTVSVFPSVLYVPPRVEMNFLFLRSKVLCDT